MEDFASILAQKFSIFREEKLRAALQEVAQIREVPAEQTLLDVGQYVKQVPLLLEGCLRVVRESPEGQEILLYYILSGQSCAMSMRAGLLQMPSEIRAIAQEPSRFILLPSRLFADWFALYPSWRAFVLDLYQQRFEDMLTAFDSLAFKRMDERLEEYLGQQFRLRGLAQWSITHQEIARDLGTSREVISRLLKQMERQGKIRLSRNSIEIIALA